MNGTIQDTNGPNAYGFIRYKIDNKWISSDKGVSMEVGKSYDFEVYKNPKGYDTIKKGSIKESSGATAGGLGAVPSGKGNQSFGGAGTAFGSRDTYWSDKAKTDEAKDPRIAYFASHERAISFVDLAIRAGAFKALEKAKDTSKLEVLQAFVSEQTSRIMAESYEAEVPTKKLSELVSDLVDEPADDAGDWS